MCHGRKSNEENLIFSKELKPVNSVKHYLETKLISYWMVHGTSAGSAAFGKYIQTQCASCEHEETHNRVYTLSTWVTSIRVQVLVSARETQEKRRRQWGWSYSLSLHFSSLSLELSIRKHSLRMDQNGRPQAAPLDAAKSARRVLLYSTQLYSHSTLTPLSLHWDSPNDPTFNAHSISLNTFWVQLQVSSYQGLSFYI